MLASSLGSERDGLLFCLPAGRRPRTQNLGLEEVGVEMDKNGVIKVPQDPQNLARALHGTPGACRPGVLADGAA